MWKQQYDGPPAWTAVKVFRNLQLVWQAGGVPWVDDRWRQLDAIVDEATRN